MRIFVIASLFFASVFANVNNCNNCNSVNYYNECDIANALIRQAKASNTDPKIVYTLAKIETGFNPLLIAFVTSSKKDYKFENATTKKGRYKDKYIVSISSSSVETLSAIAKELIDSGYSVDVGLMQINSVNFEPDSVEDIFDLDTNIKKAISVLAMCQNRYESTKNVIECYNKGFMAKKSDDYYAKFKSSFIRDFGGVK